jgi:hypothetical protein
VPLDSAAEAAPCIFVGLRCFHGLPHVEVVHQLVLLLRVVRLHKPAAVSVMVPGVSSKKHAAPWWKQRVTSAPSCILRDVIEPQGNTFYRLPGACKFQPTCQSPINEVSYLVQMTTHVLSSSNAGSSRGCGNMRRIWRCWKVYGLHPERVGLTQSAQAGAFRGWVPVARDGCWDLKSLLCWAPVLDCDPLFIGQLFRPAQAALIPIPCMSGTVTSCF